MLRKTTNIDSYKREREREREREKIRRIRRSQIKIKGYNQ